MNRMPSKMPVGAVQTYSLIRPRTPDFWRAATCEEVKCERWANGWVSKLDTSTVDGQRWARWIADKSGRHFTIDQAPPMVTFTFPAGQTCFEKHRAPRERDPLFVVRGGDHRGRDQSFRERRHTRGESWRDDMQERLSAVADARQKG